MEKKTRPKWVKQFIEIENFTLTAQCLDIFRRLKKGETGLLSPRSIMMIMTASSFKKIREIVNRSEARSNLLDREYYTKIAQSEIKKKLK